MTRQRQASVRRLGERLGSGWVLENIIGSGGTATVYRAQGPDGRQAAVKVMHPHLVGNWSRRFEREARVLAALREPSVVELYEFGRCEDVPYLVLELLSGQSLDKLTFPADFKLKTNQILAYARQALATLSVVHARGVLHRDLKPSNLFLTTSGMLKVLDFGTASSHQPELTRPDSLTGGLLGTPAFMSPEQALGRWDLVDERSDLWSLAAVIFTLLSGEHVHPARTRNEQLGRAMASSARSIRSVLPSLDVQVAQVLDRALSYRREHRFPSASAFRVALEQQRPALALTASSLTPASTLREPVRRSERLAARAFGAMLAAVALALLFVTDAPQQRHVEAHAETPTATSELAQQSEVRYTTAVQAAAPRPQQEPVAQPSARRAASETQRTPPPISTARKTRHESTETAPPVPAQRETLPVNPLDVRLSPSSTATWRGSDAPAARKLDSTLAPTPLDVRN